MNWFVAVLKKYADFSGRARRKEYWMFILIYVLIAVVVGFLDGMLGDKSILSGLLAIGLLLPSLAVTVRRLHDTDRSGWWILIGLVPAIGGIVLLVFTVLAGTPGSNQYGEDPLGEAEPG
ncbi:DUF805 domain-containing protein [Piscinibacter sp.]|uniref:DUF805 domain-containing protein n=1 Tax=Piscinibacter sp. TaxID=1903157 RepID=UPI0039E4B9B9